MAGAAKDRDVVWCVVARIEIDVVPLEIGCGVASGAGGEREYVASVLATAMVLQLLTAPWFRIGEPVAMR